VIGCEDRLRNDLYCVGWGVKLYSIKSSKSSLIISSLNFSKFTHFFETQCSYAFVSGPSFDWAV